MENESFEHQFQQDVNKATEQAMKPPVSNRPPIKISVIISIILAIIVLIETIALFIAVKRYQEIVKDDYYALELEESDYDYIYDENDNLVALNAKCTNDSGAYIMLYSDNAFKEYDSLSNLINHGIYSVSNDNLIIFDDQNDEERVLNFNWTSLADDTTHYDCQLSSDENDS